MLTLRKESSQFMWGEKKKECVHCILRHFQECLHTYKAERKESQKTMVMRHWGRMVDTVGQRARRPQIIKRERRRWERGWDMLLKQPHSLSPDLSLCSSSQASHCLTPALSPLWFRVRDPAPPIMRLFFLTVWWLLSLLCCHGNLRETVGARYIYSLSSLLQVN